MFRCDNQCSEKTLSFIHNQLMPEMLQRFSEGRRTRTIDKVAVAQIFVEKKGAPWKALESDGNRTIRARNVEKLLPRKT